MSETPRQRHIRLLRQISGAPKPLFYGIPGGDSPEDIKALYELWNAHLIDAVPRFDEKGVISDMFHVSINLRGRLQLAEWEGPKEDANDKPKWGKNIIHVGDVSRSIAAIFALGVMIVGALVWFLTCNN